MATKWRQKLHAWLRRHRPQATAVDREDIAEMNPLIRYGAWPVMQAIGKAPHALCFDAHGLQSAIVRQGMDLFSAERHGTRGKDFRVASAGVFGRCRE